MDFTPTKAAQPKDMKVLQMRAGGTAGEITSNGQRLPVLMLAPNLFVTSENIPHPVKVLANMAQADIHRVNTPADYGYFLERYKAFKGASDGPKNTR